MLKKVLSPAIINALKEALTNIYWRKADLKSFLGHSLQDDNLSKLVHNIDWGKDTPKRVSVNILIDRILANESKYQGDVLQLISNVVEMNDFSHLHKWDDGVAKAKVAEQSVVALRKSFKGYSDIIEERANQQKSKEAFRASIETRQETSRILEEFKQQYQELCSTEDHRKRGKLLEPFIKKLFDFFDIDAKSSFRLSGEEIDGAFTFDSTDYLFEAKWQGPKIQPKDISVFRMKIRDKLDNTLGLFLSISGFTENAVMKHSNCNSNVILMDGEDLYYILDARIDLPTMLSRKKRHASQTGVVFLPVREILA